MSNDIFVHFTTPADAEAIVASRRLFKYVHTAFHMSRIGLDCGHSPDQHNCKEECWSVGAVYAVSLTHGQFNPVIQTTGNNGRVQGVDRTAAVVFTTDAEPGKTHPFEDVFFTFDEITLTDAVVVTAEEAIAALG